MRKKLLSLMLAAAMILSMGAIPKAAAASLTVDPTMALEETEEFSAASGEPSGMEENTGSVPVESSGTEENAGSAPVESSGMEGSAGTAPAVSTGTEEPGEPISAELSEKEENAESLLENISGEESGIPLPNGRRDTREINRTALYLRESCGESGQLGSGTEEEILSSAVYANAPVLLAAEMTNLEEVISADAGNKAEGATSADAGNAAGEVSLSDTAEAAENEASIESPMTAPAEAEVFGVTQSVHYVDVTYLLVDASLVGGSMTAAEVFADCPDAILGGAYSTAAVYDPDPAGEYLMAIVDTSNLNGVAAAISATFSDNNEADPADYSDIILYDAEAGIIRIPRSFYFDEAGQEISRELQAELVVPMAESSTPMSCISVYMDSTDSSVTLVGDTELSVPALDATVTVPLTTPETAAAFDMDRTWIYVNDSYAPLIPEEYYFDVSTGELTLLLSPLSTYSIYIVYGDPNVLYGTMTMAASVAELAAIPAEDFTLQVDGTLKKGELYRFSGNVMYAGSDSGSSGTAIQNIWNQVGTAPAQAFENLKTYTLFYDDDSTMRSFYRYVQENGSGFADESGSYNGVELTRSSTGKLLCFLAEMPAENTVLTGDGGTRIQLSMRYAYLPMRCIENMTGAISDISSTMSVSGGTVFYGTSELRMRVMYVAADYAVIAVIGPGCEGADQPGPITAMTA